MSQKTAKRQRKPKKTTTTARVEPPQEQHIIPSQEPLLFDRWSWEEVEITDPSLQKYISLKPEILPHSGGRHEHKRFQKSKLNTVERLINRIMRTEKNTGKKNKATAIIRSTFEIIHQRTNQNPIKVLVTAIENAAPREETTRISYGGIIYHQAVDVAPQRRVDVALANITDAAKKTSKTTIRTVEECLADELIAASQNNAQKSAAIKKKEEKERIALSAR